MQIFLRSSQGLKAIEVSEAETVSSLQSIISTLYSFDFTLLQNPELRISEVFSNNSIINLHIPVLGGGKDLTEEDKALANAHLLVTICRDCYRHNSKNATRCRGKKCGHSSNLRPKKLSAKK